MLEMFECAREHLACCSKLVLVLARTRWEVIYPHTLFFYNHFALSFPVCLHLKVSTLESSSSTVTHQLLLRSLQLGTCRACRHLSHFCSFQTCRYSESGHQQLTLYPSDCSLASLRLPLPLVISPLCNYFTEHCLMYHTVIGPAGVRTNSAQLPAAMLVTSDREADAGRDIKRCSFYCTVTYFKGQTEKLRQKCRAM